MKKYVTKKELQLVFDMITPQEFIATPQLHELFLKADVIDRFKSEKGNIKARYLRILNESV